MSPEEQRRVHIVALQRHLGQQRAHDAIDPNWADTYFPPGHLSVPAERALERAQHAVALLQKTPADHPWHANRLDRAVRALDRFLELA